MMTSERKALLLGRLRREGRIVAKDVAIELGLSEDTVRRDLRKLARQGKLQRVHGGALPASPAIVGFDKRKSLAVESKVALAQTAAGLIAPGQIVFVDGGTTNGHLVSFLPPNLDVRVVTHSPNIAAALSSHPSASVEIIGGRLFKHSLVALGAITANAIRRVRPDLFVMGVTGLHPDAGATTVNAEEAEIKRQIADQSAETMVLATTEKLGTASPYLISPISALSIVLVEKQAPTNAIQAIRRLGPEVIVARNEQLA